MLVYLCFVVVFLSSSFSFFQWVAIARGFHGRGVFRWVLRALASILSRVRSILFLSSRSEYLLVFVLLSVGFVGGSGSVSCLVLLLLSCLLVGVGVLLSCCLCRPSSVCVDLDLCSLLRCVGGWWCLVLAGWSGIIVCGWGSWRYQHLSPNLQLGPFRHISPFILCCFLSLFPLSFLAFSIVSRMSCFFSWQFLGVLDIVIFVSSPLSSIMMVVLCLVCILRFSPPFPITLPVYSLLIDVLSCSRCLVGWWLSFLWCLRCLVGGVSCSFWAFCFPVPWQLHVFWLLVWGVCCLSSVGLWSCTVRLFWWCCWGTWFHGQLLLRFCWGGGGGGAVVSTCMGGCGFQIVGWQFSGFRWCLLQVFRRVCHLFQPLCTQVCSGVSYFLCSWLRPASCRWLHVSLTFCFWCVRSLGVRSSRWVVVFLPFWW